LADISVFPSVRPHLEERLFRDKNRRAQSGGLLPGLGLGLAFDQHPHDVALFHYQVLDTIDFDLGARPFSEQDAVADS
jgi:hypothetical protein